MGFSTQQQGLILPVGTQRLQPSVVIAKGGGLVPHIDFIFQDIRQAQRASLLFYSYEVCHISIRGPLFEISICVLQNICRRLAS